MEVFLLVTAGWVFSVCLHEFGHAFVAFRGGDFSVREKGYLTLNPLRYTHPLYSLLLPVVFLLVGGIGLPGGAVYINDHLLRSRGWRTGVSLAGPAMNLVLAVLISAPLWFGLQNWDRAGTLAPALAFLAQLQISALIFNLIPVPPLDGFRALAPWLPREVSARILENSNLAFWILVLVMWNVPAANRIFWGMVFGISGLLGIDPDLARSGWHLYQFWRH